MTTDSGLAYLSGLLRAGAEPLSPAARTAHRRAAGPPNAARVSDHFGEADAAQAAHAAAGHASEPDAPAEVEANERVEAEAAVVLKSSEAAGDRHAPSTDVSPGTVAVKNLPGDAVEGVEQHAHAQTQSRAVPPSSKDARADEIRMGETERTAVVTEQSPAAAGEGEIVPATRPPATLRGEPNDSAVTQSETASAVEVSPKRISKAKAADEALKKADEVPDARVGSLLLPGASSVLGSSAKRDPSARASQEDGAPTFAGDRVRIFEDGARLADASAEPAADSAAFTLEAHVEQLRALMRTARAETPDEDDGTGAARPSAVVASHRTPPLTTAARPARARPRTAPRAEFEARPETPTPAATSSERQPAALLNQETPGASSGRSTSATAESRPTTTRGALTRRGSVSPARVRGEEMTPAQSAPVRTAGVPSVALDSAPTVATASARVGPVPARGGSAAAGGGGRAPKLIINRLDVQVVRPQEPPSPPPQHATRATESPPHADHWGALDRQLLGRFSY